MTAAVYALAAVRVVLCMMPQNQWLTNHTPLAWGILRNIPFALQHKKPVDRQRCTALSAGFCLYVFSGAAAQPSVKYSGCTLRACSTESL